VRRKQPRPGIVPRAKARTSDDSRLQGSVDPIVFDLDLSPHGLQGNKPIGIATRACFFLRVAPDGGAVLFAAAKIVPPSEKPSLWHAP
ncbi:MAG TPA: hypothetical protein VF469_14030, partial [Kofleriaceae bacterium]